MNITKGANQLNKNNSGSTRKRKVVAKSAVTPRPTTPVKAKTSLATAKRTSRAVTRVKVESIVESASRIYKDRVTAKYATVKGTSKFRASTLTTQRKALSGNGFDAGTEVIAFWEKREARIVRSDGQYWLHTANDQRLNLSMISNMEIAIFAAIGDYERLPHADLVELAVACYVEAFATAFADQLNKAAGIPIVNVALTLDRSPLKAGN